MLQPIRNHVLLQPSASLYRGVVAITERYAGRTSTCSVIALGTGCHPAIKVGDIVLAQSATGNRNVQLPEGGNAYLTTGPEIFAIIKRGRILPLGRRVLLLRDNTDLISPGGIVLPETRRSQSIDGFVVSFGIPGDSKAFDPDVEIGTKVRLAAWSENHIEINIPKELIARNPALSHLPQRDGFGLIVDPNDLVFKWT